MSAGRLDPLSVIRVLRDTERQRPHQSAEEILAAQVDRDADRILADCAEAHVRDALQIPWRIKAFEAQTDGIASAMHALIVSGSIQVDGVIAERPKISEPELCDLCGNPPGPGHESCNRAIEAGLD